MAAPGKENQLSDHLKSCTNAELAGMLKDRGLPHTGKKADLVARLENAICASGSASSELLPASGSASEKAAPAVADTSSTDIEYYTTCRPGDDIAAEKQETDEDYDPDEDNELDACGSAKCMCIKPLAENPEWPWMISMGGIKVVQHMKIEAAHRDQDAMDQYHYNDFSGYGFQEMVNNQLQAFHKEYTKKNPDSFALWYLITGFAHVLPGPGQWYMCDDSEQICETMRLLGYAILATEDVLQKHGLLKPDSKIKDLPLVLAKCSQGWDWQQYVQGDELDWIVPMIERAEKNGVKLAGPWGIEDRVAELKDEYDGDEEDWTDFKWKEKFAAFAQDYGTGAGNKIGGKHYDLSKSKSRKGQMITVGPGEDPDMF